MREDCIECLLLIHTEQNCRIHKWAVVVDTQTVFIFRKFVLNYLQRRKQNTNMNVRLQCIEEI